MKKTNKGYRRPLSLLFVSLLLSFSVLLVLQLIVSTTT